VVSWRSGIEINHDLVRLETPAERELFCSQFDLFAKSGDARHLPPVLTFLYRRHHAEARPAAIATARLLRAANTALATLVEEVRRCEFGDSNRDKDEIDSQVRELRAALLEVEATEERRRDGTGAAP
jgi:hypothetical protein